VVRQSEVDYGLLDHYVLGRRYEIKHSPKQQFLIQNLKYIMKIPQNFSNARHKSQTSYLINIEGVILSFL
jgi:hypothetical protein